MNNAKSTIQCRHGYGEQFHDAPDDTPFEDCEDCFSERFESNDAVSISVNSDQKPVAEHESIGAANLRRRRPVKSSEMEMPKVSSLDSYLNSRKRKNSLSRKTKECKKKLESESSDTLEELRNGAESVKAVVRGDNDEEKEEISTLTNANSNNVGRENNDEEKEEISTLTNANSNNVGRGNNDEEKEESWTLTSTNLDNVGRGNNDEEKEEISTLTNANSNNVGRGNNDEEKEESWTLTNANSNNVGRGNNDEEKEESWTLRNANSNNLGRGSNDEEKEESSTFTSTNLDNVGRGNNDEEEKERSSTSTLMNANLNNAVEKSNVRGDLVRTELDLRENIDADSGLLLTVAGLMIKAITFQMELLVKCLWFPVSLSYYVFMLVFNPLGLLKCCRGRVLKVLKRIWNLVCENVSLVVNEWLKENKAFWKMGLKFGWGILRSAYVCTVLVMLLVSAFVIGGLVIRVAVEEPMRMQSNLNFDYTEKSPVALVPVVAYAGLRHDIRIGDEPQIGKSSGLRVIPHNHKLQATVALTLPESDYNQNLGIFQVRVDFLDYDGKTLASSRRPCMLHFKSQPIRLLLTFLKMVPILTGYTSETQNLKVSFRGFREGSIPTASLRVVIEQRAEFRPGAGIPEIYAASLTLKSELPLFKKIIWFWKKTLFVWISSSIFIMELVFALLCCRPLIMPRVRLRGDGNRGASTNEHPVQT